MAEIKFSQLTTAAQLTNDDIFALAQMQSGSLSSVKTSMIAVANFLNTQVQYTTAYGTQAKTTAGAINELKQLISLIPQFSIEVVEELPTEDISDTTIYLVPAEDPEVGNYYDEYIHVNNTWELVGTTAVDLSAYYTKLEVDGLLATKASVTEVALKENKSDMPTDVRTIIKDCKTPKSATITNGIAQFECIEENLVKGLKVTMNPIQDLHGYSNPWVGGAGKNKLNSIMTSGTGGNVTFTAYTDGTFEANGTANDTVTRYIYNGYLPSGSYIINGNPTGTSSSTYRMRIRLNGGSWSYINTTGDSNTLTVTDTDLVELQVYIANGVQVQNKVWKPMIRLSTESDSTFAPYSNICPISGRDSLSLNQCGKNLFDKTAITDSSWLSTTTGEVETSSSTTNYVVSDFIPVLANQPVYIPASNSARRWFYDLQKNPVTYLNNSGNQIYTPTNNGYIRITINKTQTNIDTYQVEQGTTATDYVPYQGQTHTETFPDTVYGGKVDFVNGGATVTLNTVDMGDLTYTSGLGYVQVSKDNIQTVTGKNMKRTNDAFEISSIWDVYQTVNSVRFATNLTPEAFKTLVTGQTLCYELATPDTIETSAEEITTVEGTNIISGTEPISECKYTELATVDDLIKIIGGQ